MKKTYSKPRLKTEAFTPQEAITACWTSFLTCMHQFPANNIFTSAYNGARPIGSVTNHTSCDVLKVTINTDGDTSPTVTPMSQFYNSGVFVAYLQSHPSGSFKPNNPYTTGVAWQSSGRYHFTTTSSENPTGWERTHS